MSFFIDTHCHLNHARFDNDLEVVIARAIDAGVTKIIIPATDVTSARTALELTTRFSGLKIAVGVHPLFCSHQSAIEKTIDELHELSQDSNVVAVGEIGLDFYHGRNHQQQQFWLDAQLDLASTVGLPVILHNRDSTSMLLERLQAWSERGPLPNPTGVFHAFCGGKSTAAWAIATGFYIGIGGMLTFDQSNDLRSTVASIPEDRLILETDSPFLTPEPLRGSRNEPSFLLRVAEELSILRGTRIEKIALQTTGNALRLFPSLVD